MYSPCRPLSPWLSLPCNHAVNDGGQTGVNHNVHALGLLSLQLKELVQTAGCGCNRAAVHYDEVPSFNWIHLGHLMMMGTPEP